MWLIYIMNTKFFNHYPREWDTLGNEWKEIITGDVLSISQASELSGFSKRFIYAQIHSMKLLSTDKDPLSKQIYSKSLQIEWRRFLMWYSHFDVLPASPFGPPSYSLKGMMDYMRYNIFEVIILNNIEWLADLSVSEISFVISFLKSWLIE